MRFTYGAATDDGERYVSQRSWMGSLNLDLWPHAGQSPFLLGTLESSLERRIDLRASGGFGHKLTFVDDGESLAKKLSNPFASPISVPFQANVDFGVGLTDDGQKHTLNIQPVIPSSISPAPI